MKILIPLLLLFLLISCSKNQDSMSIDKGTPPVKELIEKPLENSVKQAEIESEEIKGLQEEIEKLEAENRELEIYKQINFKEMKLVEQYDNPHDSNKNIYIYTNSFNNTIVDSIENVENCSRIRYKDDSHSSECFIFIGNNDYKKLLFQYDFPITKAFEEKNTFSISSGFSDGGGSISKNLIVNIEDGSATFKIGGSHDKEEIYTANLYECLEKEPNLVTFINRCFKELYPN